MILARFFTLFSFGNVTLVAAMVNVMSGLVSAFTILFLFWSISHIAKKIISETEDLSLSQYIVILGSAAVGALTYAFSDTFWFSAVEGEVYATSSFFTAIVFWAILKWENEADQLYANRWLILIAYLMGLSIGVHLLNLLAIPAIVFVYYFKKYEITPKGVVIAFLTSVLILGVVMYGVIQGVVLVGSQFEIFFANYLGTGFNWGFIFYILLLSGALIYGIILTLKYKKPVFNAILTGLLVILIGYSSFALILIRSIADTPMNQNKPDNVFTLISYLNREQYGDRPLMHGQYFNAPLNSQEPYIEGKAIYDQDKEANEYVIVDHKLSRNYSSEYKTLLPRMYSDQASPDHVKGYMQWTNTSERDFFNAVVDNETMQVRRDRYGDVIYNKDDPKRAPTFGENLQFFFKYQLDFMYFRYFMWNFSGKQSDIQSDGSVMNGNWMTGIDFIDEMRLGNQDNITPEMKNNKARNSYYMIPFLLGILGMIYLLGVNQSGKNYFWVIMLFFFFTGVAIVLYLNQPPFQPRERDYAYAGSFYAFSLYIGLGVAFIYSILKKYTKEIYAASIATVLSLSAPVILAQQNWDDHDRSNRYTARDFAKNYLESCEENAIIFTNGDNDTFPLWYVQEVEGFRTDVRVVNLSYFNTEWYINQMRKKAYKSEPIKFSLKPEEYKKGVRDILYVIPNPNLYVNEKYFAKINVFGPEYSGILTEVVSYLSTTDFPVKFKDQFDILNRGHKKVGLVNFVKLLNTLSDKKILEDSNLTLDVPIMSGFAKRGYALLKKVKDSAIPLDLAMAHVVSEDRNLKTEIRQGELSNYFPSSKLLIPANRDVIKKNKVVSDENLNKVRAIEWDFAKSHLTKNHIMVLDMLNANNWERPMYFASTVGGSQYLNLEDYFQLEGLAYKIVPIKSKSNDYLVEGSVNSDILYDNIMNKFVWGGLDVNADKIYLDENNRRFIINYKGIFRALAKQLIDEGKKDKAEKVLDKYAGLFPNDMLSFGYYDLLLAEQYLRIGKKDKGLAIVNTVADNFKAKIIYYSSLEDKYLHLLTSDVERTAALYQEILNVLVKNKEVERAQQLAAEGYTIVENRFNFNEILSSLDENSQQNWYNSIPPHQKALLNFQFTIEKYTLKK